MLTLNLQTNPVKFTYDIVGNRFTLTTYQAAVTNVETFPSSPGNLTTWTYDASGALLSKSDAANQQVNYTYDIAGRVLTRTWARGVVTTYGYTAGQLTSVQYTNDPTNTPTVSIAYDRLGRITDQSNDRSTTDYNYDPATLRLTREETTIDPDGAAGPLPSLTRSIDRSRDNLQRPTGFVLGNEHAVGYGYDVSGRLATLSAQGLPNLPGKTHAFAYLYAPGSSLISKVTGPVHEVDNTYEANRNVLSQKKNTRTVGTPGDLSIIGYTVNELGQRVQRNLSGEIRAEFYGGLSNDPYATNWTYDALGQVIAEDKPATASDRGYTYDQIGNRLTSTADTVTTTYSSNALNQYQEISVPSVQSVVPVHDQDGNMTAGLLNGSGNGQFEYDGANQLIRTQSTAAPYPTRYAYDASGRRVAKITYNANNEPTAATVFLYDGWNLIAEYKLDVGAWCLDRTYTWGLDLSCSTQGAGGVGGLLSVTKNEAQSTTHFYPIYDGNGNIEAYLDSNGAHAAIYQYDAFGNVLSGGGKGAALDQAKFSHRFSTKYQDAETGLMYYGYRYKNTVTGRWINRDPIEEQGGNNLYGMVGNSPVNETDLLGMNEVIVSGGCNPKRGGYDYRADWLLPDLGDKGVRWVFPDAGHDVNWKNFIISAEEEIKKRKIKLQDKEYIEWHVEYSSYILRAVNDGQPEKAYVDEVVALAKKHQVLLRWFNTKVEFAKNINSSIMGGERGPAGRISRITFFAHGFPGQINLTYPGVQLFIPRPPLLPDDDMKLTTGDLKSGYLSKSAFTDHAIGISCACRSATSTSGSGGDSFRDVWKDTFGFEFYASPTRTSYKDAKNPVPSEGGAWVPGPIPE